VGVVLAVVVRPIVVGPLLARSGLRSNEKKFVMFAGLKGAVPILLGSYILGEAIPEAHRLYGIVVVVVVFSVVVQGSLVPTVARMLQVPMREVELEPWSLGVRLRDEPNGVHRLTVAAGSTADGRRIADLSALPEGAWVSFVVRSGHLVPVSADTVLQADDEALVLGDASVGRVLHEVFEELDGESRT
jgi:cell volume regulation protein A